MRESTKQGIGPPASSSPKAKEEFDTDPRSAEQELDILLNNIKTSGASPTPERRDSAGAKSARFSGSGRPAQAHTEPPLPGVIVAEEPPPATFVPPRRRAAEVTVMSRDDLPIRNHVAAQVPFGRKLAAFSATVVVTLAIGVPIVFAMRSSPRPASPVASFTARAPAPPPAVPPLTPNAGSSAGQVAPAAPVAPVASAKATVPAVSGSAPHAVPGSPATVPAPVASAPREPATVPVVGTALSPTPPAASGSYLDLLQDKKK